MRRHARTFRTLLPDLLAFVLRRSSLSLEEELESITADRTTVILVSGFAASRRTLKVIRKRLSRDGFNVLTLSMDWQDMTDGLQGLHRISRRLCTLVLNLRKSMTRSKIFLVAHSAGGLVARDYIQMLGGDHYCDGLITLATPHRGAWIVLMGFLTHFIFQARCLLQMLPSSRFIRILNEASYPERFPLLSIYSDLDPLCPSSSTRLPDVLLKCAQVRTKRVNVSSHNEFLLHKGVYQEIVEFILREEGKPAAPELRDLVSAQ